MATLDTAQSSTTTLRRRLLALAVAQALTQSAQAAVINVDSSADIIAADGQCTLREASLSANSGVAGVVPDCEPGSPGASDSIVISPTVTEIQLTQGYLRITQDVVISGVQGTPPIVRADVNSRIFSIDDGGAAGISVTLNDLHLTGGRTNDDGGAIRSGAQTELRLNRCTVDNNVTFDSGGGIFTDGNLFLQGTTVSNNYAEQRGGAIAANGDVTIIDASQIYRNDAGVDYGFGGGIFARNLQIQNNSEVVENGASVGGGISASTLTMTNSVLSDNRAGSAGGISATTIQVTNSVIENNRASISIYGQPGRGGGIFVREGYIGYSSIAGNSATGNGGGIYMSSLAGSTLTLSNSTVSGNTSSSAGGGVAADGGRLFLYISQVTDNSALGVGGGVFVDDNGLGGPADLALNEANVSGNSAAVAAGLLARGALSVGGGSTINNNVSEIDGGGVFVYGDASISDSQISGNSAVQFGGGIVSAGTISLYNVDIVSNQSGRGGGIELLPNSTLIGFGADLELNVALRGGAIAVGYDSTVDLANSTVANNSADIRGGGITVEESGLLTFNDSTLLQNQSGIGGGVFLEAGAEAEFQRSSLASNTASTQGGAVFSEGDFRLTDSTVSGNAAQTGGGIWSTGEFSINQSTISGNSAQTGQGAGVYTGPSSGPSAGLFNSIIAGNNGGDCNEPTAVSGRNSLSEDGSCLDNMVNPLLGNPMLGPITDRGYHLPLSGSPVVDAGADSPFCDVGIDQARMPRPIDGDADGNAQCDMGSVEFVDVFPPTAELNSYSVLQDETEALIALDFRDVDGRVSVSSLDDNDVRISGPNGFDVPAEQLLTNPDTDAPLITAAYRFAAPGGTWGVEDSGEYRAELQANQIFDTAVTGANSIDATSAGLSFTVGFPDIDVRGNGQSITAGDTTPSLTDDTDFGSVITGTSRVRTFDIFNVGTADLLLTINTIDNDQFALLESPSGTLPPGESRSLQVRFTPVDESVATATLRVNSTDVDEQPFDFVLQGTGVPTPVVEIAISGNGVEIQDGDTSPTSGDGTHFGEVRPGQSRSQTFVVTNQGTATLNLTDSVAVNGSGFAVTRQPESTSLAPVSSVDFEITFAPQAAGTFAGNVVVANSDPDENPYDFSVSGVAIANVTPIVEDATFTVLNDANAGALVGQVNASDPDGSIPSTDAFDIIAGNGAGVFSIDDEGMIRVADPLGLIQDYVLTVAVSDNEDLQGIGIITIEVTASEVVFVDGFE